MGSLVHNACVWAGRVHGDDSCEEKEWELTQEEKEFFHKMMEDYCMQKNGCTLREFFEKYGHSTSEV